MKQPESLREGLREGLQKFGRAWLERFSPRCDWCRTPLTEDDVTAYVDWCMELGKLLPPTQKTQPPAKVPCLDCAGGAFSELVDGIPFAPTSRPEVHAPGYEPKRGTLEPIEDERERYP